jgi:aspartokinase
MLLSLYNIKVGCYCVDKHLLIAMVSLQFFYRKKAKAMNKSPITKVESDHEIIQVKFINVEKNPLFVGNIFRQISSKGVNVDMISQVMLEDDMRIDFTCPLSDQRKLNEALEEIKRKHDRIMIFQNRNVAKVMVEGEKMKDEIGVAANVFEIFGQFQIPFSQVTTSDTSISFVIPGELKEVAVQEIKKAYQL